MARLRQNADELVALGPDALVAGVGPTTAMLQQATRSIPIVMAQAVDAVGGGFVKSMARPGGNITGFTQFEFTLAAKWVEMLREIAPHVNRVGVVRDNVRGGQVGVAQWERRSAWNSTLSICASMATPSAPSRSSHANRVAD